MRRKPFTTFLKGLLPIIIGLRSTDVNLSCKLAHSVNLRKPSAANSTQTD